MANEEIKLVVADHLHGNILAIHLPIAADVFFFFWGGGQLSSEINTL